MLRVVPSVTYSTQPRAKRRHMLTHPPLSSVLWSLKQVQPACFVECQAHCNCTSTISSTCIGNAQEFMKIWSICEKIELLLFIHDQRMSFQIEVHRNVRNKYTQLTWDSVNFLALTSAGVYLADHQGKHISNVLTLYSSKLSHYLSTEAVSKEFLHVFKKCHSLKRR